MGNRCFAALPLLLLASALLFSGCDASDDGGAESPWKGVPVEGAAETKSVKEKFGIPETVTGKDGVEAAFQELSAFIRNGGLKEDLGKAPEKRVIKTGDWIDLGGGLKVSAYGEGQTGANGGEISLAADDPKGRLVIVGINSFRHGKGSGGAYAETANNGVEHVVFHFQDVPGKHRMNAQSSNGGGYEASEMREYLVPVEKNGEAVGGSGNFLAGLLNAGVPESVLWGPKRHVSAGGNVSTASELSDLLWLPTEREMFENGKDDEGGGPFSGGGETAANQARLEYYASNALRQKSQKSWLSSALYGDSQTFLTLINQGFLEADEANVTDLFFVPAFCVT
jgi:hypothetical protein